MDSHTNGNKPPRPQKIAIIGSGNIGTELWKELSERGAADNIVIWNRSDKSENDKFKGTQRAVDQANLIHANHGSTSQFKFLTGADKLDEAMSGANIVIVTAGIARKPGMPRSDLLSQNCAIIDPIAESANKAASDAVFIIATNPVDTITQRFHEKSGVPAERVIGLSGELDRARMTQSICNALQIPPEQIEGAIVIGQHGPDMVPVINNVRIHRNGHAENLRDMDVTIHEKIRKETINGGGILVEMLGTSDHIAPAAALTKMTETVINAKWRGKEGELVASAMNPKENVYIGQPVKVTSRGVEVQPLPELSQFEAQKWRNAVKATREALADLPGRAQQQEPEVQYASR